MALISLSTIAIYFSDQISILRKGENAGDSGHIKEINFDGSVQMLKGKILASMKNRTYDVEVSCNKDICIMGKFEVKL